MKQLLLVLFFNFYVQSYSQQLQTYSFEQLQQLVEKNPRPILLYFYTDWCQYCKMLQQTTFKNKQVIEKLNKNYYVVFFNAETKTTITYNHKQYKFVPKGIKTGSHELVNFYLGKRQQIYPTIIFLDTNFNEILFLQSYISANDFLEII